MKNSTVIITATITLLTGLVQIPDINHALIGAIATHPAISTLLTGIVTVISLLHDPKKNQ